jgi:hypothetical protein
VPSAEKCEEDEKGNANGYENDEEVKCEELQVYIQTVFPKIKGETNLPQSIIRTSFK